MLSCIALLASMFAVGTPPIAPTSPLAGAPEHAASAQAGIAAILQCDASNRDGLNAGLIVEEVVFVERKADAGARDRGRDLLADAIEKRRKIGLQAAQTPEEDDRVNSESDIQLGSINEYVTVHDLNENVAIRSHRTIDPSRQREREDLVDLRDCDQIIGELGLSPSSSLGLCQTRSVYRKADSGGTFIPHVSTLRMESDTRYRGDRISLEFGCLPQWALSTDFALTLEARLLTVKGDVRIVGKKLDGGSFRATLDPELGHRLRRFQTFRSDGSQIEEWEYSEYKPVGTIVIPFHVVKRICTERGVVEYREVRRKHVALAPANGIAEEVFRTPQASSLDDRR